uniref:Uncharacterized protein n=1 Tax=Panagrolaimus superbus TaxID=310955 RepID=A0A914YGK5_9BILA
MNFHHFSITVIVIFVAGATFVAGDLDIPDLLFDGSESKAPLSEYGAVMPPEAYKKLLEIHNKRHMIALDKFKELDDLFMTLPKEVLKKMPLPKIFRQLPADVQKHLHDVYYNKSLPFEAKLEALDEIITSLPQDLLKLLPQAPEFPEVPEAVEFQVSVLLQFNGYFNIDSLRDYLTPEMYDQILIIIRKKNLPEATRAHLIGRILKEAYAQNPSTFPLPMGESSDNETIPESIRRASLHLMFAKNPFDEKEPFEKVIEELKELSLFKNSTKTDIKYQHGWKNIKRGFKKIGKSLKKRAHQVENKVKEVAMKNVDKFIEKYGIVVTA